MRVGNFAGALQFLKNPQEKLGALNTLEAAEVLVV